MNAICRFFAVLIVAGSLTAYADDPDIFISLTLTSDHCGLCAGRGIGLDPDATQNGIDDFDVPSPPGAPFNTGAVTFLTDSEPLSVDVRDSDEQSLTFTLFADNGAPVGQAPADIVMTWTPADFGVGNTGFTTATLESQNGSVLADLTVDSTHTFTGDDTTVLIVLKKGDNAAPVAVNDDRSVFVTEFVDGGSVPIVFDVLTNDINTDGDTLEITSIDGAAGVTAINGTTQIDYTPPAFAGDQTTDTDTFTYTISDGNGGESTATVTVSVFSGDLTSIRTHATLSKAGETADDGLEVTITLTFSTAAIAAAESITVIEHPPIFQSGAFPYYVPAGAGLDGKDIAGPSAETFTSFAGNETTTLTFVFTPAAIEAGVLTFTYRLVGDALDREPDQQIDGTASYIFEGGQTVTVTTPSTTFTPVEALNHPADTNTDCKISIFEFLGYAGPVAAVFQEGINGGQYVWDDTTLTPKTSNDDPVPNSAHPADTNGDLQITIFEFLGYAGPVAAVFQEGINGGEYCFVGGVLTPKATDDPCPPCN
jgi:hypothetical protein